MNLLFTKTFYDLYYVYNIKPWFYYWSASKNTQKSNWICETWTYLDLIHDNHGGFVVVYRDRVSDGDVPNFPGKPKKHHRGPYSSFRNSVTSQRKTWNWKSNPFWRSSSMAAANQRYGVVQHSRTTLWGTLRTPPPLPELVKLIEGPKICTYTCFTASVVSPIVLSCPVCPETGVYPLFLRQCIRGNFLRAPEVLED